MKKILVSMIVIFSMIMGGITVYGNEKLEVKLDGNYINFPDAQPYIDQNDRTLVPIRFIAEAMGTDVMWEENGKTETVTLRRDKKVIDLKIGEYGATVNGQRWALDTAAVLKEDRTFVPLRFVSEILGAEVNWDESNWTVEIKDKTKTEPVETPKPTATPSPTTTPSPTSTQAVTPTPVSTSVPTPKPVETPKPTPSWLNPIPGDPYFLNGITSMEDTKRFIRLQGLLKYDDITSISGDDNGEDLGRLGVAYGAYNPKKNKVGAYINVDARESYNSFKIMISTYGPNEIQRLREVIDIAILGDQDYKDFIYNTILSCKDGFTGGKVDYPDGNYFFVKYINDDSTKDTWGENAFYVTVWR